MQCIKPVQPSMDLRLLMVGNLWGSRYGKTVHLADAVMFAALQGVTTLLPVSASGHQFVAPIWLGTPRGLTALQALADLGCLVAIVVVVRRRLGRACLEGIRGLLRPAVLQSSAGGRDALAVLVASLVAGGTELLVRPQLTAVNEMPLVAGAGLLLTGLTLASTAFAPPPRQVAPGALGALLVGLAHGLAMVPGMSRIGAAYVALRWLGIGSWRAAEVALMVSVPVMALQGARLAFVRPDFGALGNAQLALTLVLAFVTASLAASWWKGLCERRESAWLSLWVLPLGLAVLAYGRALPDPQSRACRLIDSYYATRSGPICAACSLQPPRRTESTPRRLPVRASAHLDPPPAARDGID